jgi:hypothetical protein
MKRGLLIISSVLMLLSASVKGQELSIYGNSLNGIMTDNTFAGGSRGISLGINYLKPLKDDFKWLAGMEFNSVSWGNNFVSNLGVSYAKPISGKWSWSITASTQQGVALFKPSPLYSWGLSGIAAISFQLTAKSAICLGSGLKYYDCPEYARYSLISHYLDFPVEIHYNIKLGK